MREARPVGVTSEGSKAPLNVGAPLGRQPKCPVGRHRNIGDIFVFRSGRVADGSDRSAELDAGWPESTLRRCRRMDRPDADGDAGHDRGLRSGVRKIDVEALYV